MRLAGINLSDAKRELVYGRIVRRIRAMGLKGFDAYCELLEHNVDQEAGAFVNAITTNLTSFFREEHHFRFLSQTLVPYWQSTREPNARIKVWSAGCSTGEEPYSLAMTLLEALPLSMGRALKILATDIDTNVLGSGAEGVYDFERVQGIDQSRLQRWFLRGKAPMDHKVRVAPELQRVIDFRHLNLMTQWPLKGPLDLIFCRNVVIYFDKETQRRLFQRFAELLAPDGHLVIGHSETLYGVSEEFDLIGRTIYRKLPKPAGARK
jgi:chemotaxis protein methyltransferase CheR